MHYNQDVKPGRQSTDQWLQGYAEKVVLVGVLDLHRDDVTGMEPAGIAQVDFAVDLGRIGLRAAGRAAGLLVDRVDEDVERRADLGASFSAEMRAESAMTAS